MSEVKYFEREYNYLHAAGAEFAEKHSSIGRYLRLTDRDRKDPFVERLLEAFAFLSGRIHERLDDDMPEFAGSLLEQLFPHMLRPFPSCSIIQARPISGTITQPVPVDRGSEVQTPAGKYQVKYRVAASSLESSRTLEKSEPADFIFRTTQSLNVLPIQMRQIRVEEDSDGRSSIILAFHLNRNVTFSALNLSRLPIYLSGSPRLKHTLLHYLTAFTRSISIREVSKPDAPFQALRSFSVDIPELTREVEDEEELALIPYARQTFTGFRLLQDYFAFPDRFFFLELNGFQDFQASEDGHPFEIKIQFDRLLSREFKPDLKNILINCVPIVNLFERSAEPVSVNQRMPEYYIIPDADRRKSREIYALKGVKGVNDENMSQYSYTPITSYNVLDVNDPEYAFQRFYSTIYRPVDGDMGETSVRLFGPSIEQDDFPRETLSIEALMTNGMLPSKYLEVNSITEATSFPEGMAVTNVSAPSNVLPCPDRQNFLWSLISHLTISYTTLADTTTLKTLLSLYNWSPIENNPNRKKIHNGIVKVRPPESKNLYRNRALIRGIEFTIEIDARYFEHGDGDIYLFGLVLSRFLSQYVTINSSVMLKFIDPRTNKEFTWDANPGKIFPL